MWDLRKNEPIIQVSPQKCDGQPVKVLIHKICGLCILMGYQTCSIQKICRQQLPNKWMVTYILYILPKFLLRTFLMGVSKILRIYNFRFQNFILYNSEDLKF